MASQDVGKLVLRLSIGGLMLFHGVGKLIHGIDWLQGMMAAKNLPSFLAYGVYVGEVVAPLLLIIGFLTRPAALIVVIDMIAAILLVQKDHLGELNRGGGWSIELEMLYLLGALAIAFLGSGAYALSKGKGRLN